MILGEYQTRERMLGEMIATIHVVVVRVHIPTIAVHVGTAGQAAWMRKVLEWGCDGITTFDTTKI
jgi:hypothetical protein